MPRSRHPAGVTSFPSQMPWDQAILYPWVATRHELIHFHGEHQVRKSVEAGQIVRVARDLYAPVALAGTMAVRADAALRATRSRGAITGMSALFLAGFLDEAPPRVVIAIDRHHHATRAPHGTAFYRCTAKVPVWMRDGLPIAEPSWALLHAMREQPAPKRLDTALTVLAHRDIDVAEVAGVVHESPYAQGRRELIKALALHGQGIESPLEYRGMRDVLTGPEFAHLQRQVRVEVAGRRYRLDSFDADALVAIEFDGKQYHQTPERWEADRLRDLALASVGIHTVRLTHRMVAGSPELCRAWVLAVVRTRRRALAA